MATDNSNARGVHVSPGVYSREVDMTYAVKSLGITTLGVVGETQRGPAFQPMLVENWRDFVSTFGGTNPEKFKGSQYPKYELPYIAKSYLSESKQLQVCRVLGLGGYNAGPAWIVTANGTDADGNEKKIAVAVLRSRGSYLPYKRRAITSSADCECSIDSYDTLNFEVGEWAGNNGCKQPKTYNMDALGIAPYTPLYAVGNECIDYHLDGGEGSFNVSVTNRGRFKIIGFRNPQSKDDSGTSSGNVTVYYNEKTDSGSNGSVYDYEDYFEYPVSLNPADKEYILKVLGSTPDDADAPVYVESLYDVALSQAINEGKVSGITDSLAQYNVYYGADYCGLEPVYGLLNKEEETLSRRDVGKRFLASKGSTGITIHKYDYGTNKPQYFGKTLSEAVSSPGQQDPFTGFENYAYVSLTLKGGDKKIVTGYWGTPEGVDTSKVLCNLKDKTDTYRDYEIVDVRIPAQVGEIYTVVQYTDESGKRHYYYRSYEINTVLREWNKVYPDAPFNAYIALDKLVPYEVAQQANNNPNFSSLLNQAVAERTASTEASHETGVYNAPAQNAPGQQTSSDNPVTQSSAVNYVSEKLLPVTAVSEGRMDDFLKSMYSFKSVLVKNNEDGMYYESFILLGSGLSVTQVTCDLNDYKSAYRFSSTPWIVSNIKGDYTKFEVNRLFRFHTISDGNASVNEVKISIENIRPDEGTFDVLVRAIDDTDYSPMVLEKYMGCSLVPGEKNYIAFKIGSYDGSYEARSKFITVEVNENTATKNSIPAGFMGYPVPKYDGADVAGDSNSGVTMPHLKYNLNYDEDIKNKKQYFGLSDLVGVDIDAFTFKGNMPYIETPEFRTPGFHLDSRINDEAYTDRFPALTVDGESGYTFEAVSTNNRTSLLAETPVIGKESEMAGSIYEYVNLRKFTVYFYGGFDGWDPYRAQRSNTDEFKMSKYLGQYDEYSGEGFSFNRIQNPEVLGLNQQGITSDWYAYLAAIRQFANPESVDINVFATPGIDYVNNKLLVEETIEMLEEERADSIYIVTTPDKPMGAGDYVDEMYTPEEAVYNLEDTEIDSNYTCTYYPWVKYFDVDNNQYVYLPATKDAVRNMAMTDNTTYPWFAPAGIGRGNVDCVRARFITKIGEEDDLYNGRINPVKTFSSEGVKLWGQKNLQIAESQLNRIAVRRLLLRMRKLISIACLGMIFDPNDSTAEKTFLSTVKPIMDNIKSNRGISDYRIEVNSTVESRERRELPAKIFFKPYNALEYIVLDFVLTPESVSFDDI